MRVCIVVCIESMNSVFICCVLLVGSLAPALGFLPKITPGLFMESPLETIITQRAVISTFTARIREELFTDNIFMRDILLHHSQPNSDVFYVLLLLLSLYQRHMYSTVKIEGLDRFLRTRRLTNSVLFIVLFIFTKNIDTAI